LGLKIFSFKRARCFIRLKLGELPGYLKTKAEKLRLWKEIKDQPSMIPDTWANNEKEERYQELMAKKIILTDTALR
jgi:hypothetical protein